MQTSKESAGVDKQGLWGWWHDSVKWQDDLHKRAAHKALDIPEEDPVITTNTRTGLDWKGIAVIIAGMVAAGSIGGVVMNQQSANTQAPAPAAAAPATLNDADYEIRFYDAAGNPIQVDRWPGTMPNN